MGLQIHWRAPLQPKGFLKIIEFFVVIVTFSLVAGFAVSTMVDFDCDSRSDSNYTGGPYNISLTAGYPFSSFSESVTNNDTRHPAYSVSFPDGGVARSAEFFVGWGVITMLYCIAAVLMYMLVTANERLEKTFDIFVVVDIVVHVILILCWFIGSVDWTFAFYRIKTLLNQRIDGQQISICNDTVHVEEYDRDSVIYVQAQIAVVFGFLLQLLLVVNIGWLVIDTSWWINWRARRGHSRI